MKKLLLFICAAMMIFSCGKEESGNKTVIDPVAKKETWAKILKMYPFLDGFPVFDGEVENCQYKELGSMKALTCTLFSPLKLKGQEETSRS